MKKLIMVVLGAALTAAGLNWFLIPARIAAGGVSGIATILENLFSIRASITILALNIPLLILAWVFKGKKTLFRALTGAVLMSFFLEVLSLSPFKVSDPIVSAIAGGLMTGLGMGLIFKAEFSTGGTDIMALLLQLKYPYLPIGTLLLYADGLVIITAGILFKSIEIV